jgi:hypothetical protein
VFKSRMGSPGEQTLLRPFLTNWVEVNFDSLVGIGGCERPGHLSVAIKF